MNRSSFNSYGNAEGPDKVDMSLDDIIRLNKQQIQGQQAAQRKPRIGARGRLAVGRRVGAPLHRGGGGVNKPLRRRGQGVITGLAARKAALLKGVSPLKRPAPNRGNPNTLDTNRAPAKLAAPFKRTQPVVSQRRHTLAHAQMQRRLYTQPGAVANTPFRLRRKWNAPPVNEAQREARQATFLSRRGLKVRAQVQKRIPVQAVQRAQRTRAWHTSPNTSILTVSIDNPEARTHPEPAHSWSLHPPVATPAESTLAESEKKKPKGVALQFDINSVGKQTAMTLNERFRILKTKRAAVQQNPRGGRFVTVD